MKILVLPILIALGISQSGLICDHRPVSSDCEPLEPGVMLPYLMVRHQATLFDGALTVRFDTVLNDNRCYGSMVGCSGQATIRLLVSTADRHSATLDMIAWSNPPYPDDGPFHTVDTLGFYITLRELWDHQAGPRPMPYGTYTLGLEILRKDPDGRTGKEVVPARYGSETTLAAPYSLDTAFIVDDSLHLQVVYGGGCETHYFVPFIVPPEGEEWIGTEASLFLHHLDNRDFCAALVSRPMAIDLSPLKRLCTPGGHEVSSPRRLSIKVYEYDPETEHSPAHLVTVLNYSY